MKKVIVLLSIMCGLSTLSYGQSEPPYGMSQLEAYAVFSDAVRTGDLELALTFGEWMLVAKPRQIRGHGGFNLERQLDRFVTIYATLAEKSADPAEKNRYYGKALGIFDLRALDFEHQGRIAQPSKAIEFVLEYLVGKFTADLFSGIRAVGVHHDDFIRPTDAFQAGPHVGLVVVSDDIGGDLGGSHEADVPWPGVTRLR
jgi:hypothetical protein